MSQKKHGNFLAERQKFCIFAQPIEKGSPYSYL